MSRVRELKQDIKGICETLGYSRQRYESIIAGRDEQGLEDQITMLYERLDIAMAASEEFDCEWGEGASGQTPNNEWKLFDAVSGLVDKIGLPDSEFCTLTQGKDVKSLEETVRNLKKRLAEKKGHIPDAGDYLPGARKDDASAAPQLEGSSSGSHLPALEEWWPMPDWAELVTNNVLTAEAACHLHFFRKNLAKVPPYEFRAVGVSDQDWDRLYLKAVSVVKALVPTIRTLDDYKRAKVEYNIQMGWKYGKRPEGSDGRVICPPYALGRSSSRRMSHPWGITQMAWYRQRSLHYLGWPTNPDIKDNSRYIICDFDTLHGKQWAAVECVGNGVDRVSELTPNRDEAVEAAHQKIRETGGKFTRAAPEYVVPKRPCVEGDVVRVGPDWRGGSSISIDSFIEQLGFRGVQWGEWVPQKERQGILDNTYDAFCDLTDLFSLDLRVSSFYGLLGISFGARGKGFAGGSAHFEPVNRIIHLTRTAGAGGVAHEWAHALDDYLGVGAQKRFNTHKSYFSEIIAFKEILPQTVSANPSCVAMEAMLDAIRGKRYQTGFYMDAQRLGRNYWGSCLEMFARVFEACVYDALLAQNRQSDYLVYGVEENRFGEKHGNAGNPYPTGGERKQFNACVFNAMGVWKKAGRFAPPR